MHARCATPFPCILAGKDVKRLLMMDIGKLLLGLGIVIALVGAVLLLAARFGLPLGRLPGDFAYRGKNVSVYFPLGTSILVSLVLSALLYLISRFHR